MSPNALNGTYLGNMTLTEMTIDPFDIQPYDFELDRAHAINGLPSVIASLAGIPEDPVSYFMIDFNIDKTITWNQTCNQTVGATEESCFDAPTFLSNFYTPGDKIESANFTG